MFKGDKKKFENKVWLASPTMHGPEMKYVKEGRCEIFSVN